MKPPFYYICIFDILDFCHSEALAEESLGFHRCFLSRQRDTSLRSV